MEKQIEVLLDRLIDSDNRTRNSKERIGKLERQKIVLAEQLAKPAPGKRELEDCVEFPLKPLSNSWKIYEKDQSAMQQTALKRTFA